MKIKSLLLSTLLLIAATSQAKVYHYKEVKGDATKTRIYTLDNGLKVYLSVNKEVPRIQTYIAVKTGSRNDPAETTGLAHYLEHIMFKGTKTFGTSNYEKEKPFLQEIEDRYEKYRLLTDQQQRKKAYHEIDSVSQLAAKYFIPNEYDKLMSTIGAKGTNAYTSNDVTCYVEDIPANEVENWAKIQSDRFQNAIIRGFHTELEAVYEEYNIGIAKDGRKMWAAFQSLLTPTHPYGTQTTIGTQEHLKNPSIVNIKKYFNKYYVPNNIAICMAGDLNPDNVIQTIDKYFGTWKADLNFSQPTFPKQQPITQPRDTTVYGLEAEQLMLGWRFQGAASEQQDTIDVIAEILSNGKAGLMDVNLEQQMKCLSAGAFNNSLAEYGSLTLMGLPNEGQTLKELKELLLSQVDLLKKGKFADDLIPAIVNNMKRDYYERIQKNSKRADLFVDAFINGQKWEDVVNKLNRISKITKQQIIDFANKYLNNNYVCVYKAKGEDKTLKKIDKPQITPIPSNREIQSDFVKNIANSKTNPIQPKFVNFNEDITKGKTKNGLPILYVKNNDNGLFSLAFYYNYGSEDNNKLQFAASYLDYLGTDKMSASQIKKEFYKLACDYSINVGARNTTIALSGLSENMPKALTLLEQLLSNAKVDQNLYAQFVEQIKKLREDNKKNQEANFKALRAYAVYGAYNPVTNVMSNKQLTQTTPQELINEIKNLRNIKHEVIYYGPEEIKTLASIIQKNHKIGKKLIAAPQGKHYVEQQTPNNEIIIAPYKAKNIYMMQYHNSNREWKPQEQAKIELFNEYFGGGMNGIVFQELRETRGLAYSARADYGTPSYKDQKESVTTNIITQNDKMMDCIRGFKDIIDNMPISQKSFDIAKQALTKRIATNRTTKIGIIYRYLEARDLGLDYDLREKVYKAIPNITLKDIADFEKEVMVNKPYKYVILGDENNLDIKSLEKIAPVKRVSTDTIFKY